MLAGGKYEPLALRGHLLDRYVRWKPFVIWMPGMALVGGLADDAGAFQFFYRAFNGGLGYFGCGDRVVLAASQKQQTDGQKFLEHGLVFF
jgi:hypothetical protein